MSGIYISTFYSKRSMLVAITTKKIKSAFTLKLIFYFFYVRIFLNLFFAVFAVSAFALSDGGNFLVIPTAEVLADKSYQVKGTIGFHQSSCKSSGMCDRHPFVTSLRYGLLNNLDFGIQYGSTVSIDVKTKLIDKYGVIPTVSLGARAFVQSPEAYFYSVPKSERKDQTGEFFSAAEWGGQWWKIVAGVSAFPAMTADDVAPFWGFEQNLASKKVSVLYEGFFRYGFSHHNIGLNFAPVEFLRISAGATEFYRYFFKENGDLTFRIVNRDAENGYRAPGVYMSIAINGSISGAKIPNQKFEIDSLKKQIASHDKELAFLQERLDEIEALYYAGGFEGADSSGLGKNAAGENLGGASGYMQNFQNELDSIHQEYKSDNWNMEILREKEQSFVDKGGAAKRFLIRTAKNKSMEQGKRITAIRIMSHFPDEIYLEPLSVIAIDNSDLAVAREAVLSIGAIDAPNSRKKLSEIANQTTGIVRETIIEILGTL